jgi:predicted transcriptional regulator with HTH domain
VRIAAKSRGFRAGDMQNDQQSFNLARPLLQIASQKSVLYHRLNIKVIYKVFDIDPGSSHLFELPQKQTSQLQCLLNIFSTALAVSLQSPYPFLKNGLSEVRRKPSQKYLHIDKKVVNSTKMLPSKRLFHCTEKKSHMVLNLDYKADAPFF